MNEQQKPPAIQCIEMASKIQMLTTLQQLLTFGRGKMVLVTLQLPTNQQVQVQVKLDDIFEGLRNLLDDEVNSTPSELEMAEFIEQVRRESEKMVELINQQQTRQ